MKCKILRSDTKHGAYLYLRDGESIDDLPKELLRLIGKYTEVMELDLSQRKKLAQVDIEQVKNELEEKGYYLQFQTDADRQLISYG